VRFLEEARFRMVMAMMRCVAVALVAICQPVGWLAKRNPARRSTKMRQAMASKAAGYSLEIQAARLISGDKTAPAPSG
jgi:fumarate reductase subunit D